MITVHRGTKATPSLSRGSHTAFDLCTPVVCKYNGLNNDTYETPHADGCSSCTELVVNVDDLCEILNAGKIPPVLSIDDADDNKTVTLVPAEPGIKYIAISGVWSDGLGNRFESAKSEG